MMIASERFLRIVNTVNERGFISTKELSENLDVTETTIRRDCEELEKQGLLIRVHGGAKSIEQKTILSNKDEKQMSERITNNKEKDLVCKKAASFIRAHRISVRTFCRRLPLCWTARRQPPRISKMRRAL